MTKTTGEIEKFIELRAQGLSFDKIAEQINVSKPTLLKWSTQYQAELEQAQYFELQRLLSQYRVMRKNRVEVICSMLSSALKELSGRADTGALSIMQTDRLLNFILTLEGRLERETNSKKLEFSSARDMERLLESHVEVD